jgi:hypothetical protein
MNETMTTEHFDEIFECITRVEKLILARHRKFHEEFTAF